MDPAQLSWLSALVLLLVAFTALLLWHQRDLKKCAPYPGKRPPSARVANCMASQVYVRDIMSRELVTLAPDDNAKRAWRRLQENRIKTLPVVQDGVVVGVIALVDFLKHLGLAWHTLPEDLTGRANIVMDQEVATLMSTPARTISADMPLAELVPMLSDTGLRHIPVVNAGGKLVGIVTQSDLIAGLAHLLSRPPSE